MIQRRAFFVTSASLVVVTTIVWSGFGQSTGAGIDHPADDVSPPAAAIATHDVTDEEKTIASTTVLGSVGNHEPMAATRPDFDGPSLVGAREPSTMGWWPEPPDTETLKAREGKTETDDGMNCIRSPSMDTCAAFVPEDALHTDFALRGAVAAGCPDCLRHIEHREAFLGYRMTNELLGDYLGYEDFIFRRGLATVCAYCMDAVEYYELAMLNRLATVDELKANLGINTSSEIMSLMDFYCRERRALDPGYPVQCERVVER